MLVCTILLYITAQPMAVVPLLRPSHPSRGADRTPGGAVCPRTDVHTPCSGAAGLTDVGQGRRAAEPPLGSRWPSDLFALRPPPPPPQKLLSAPFFSIPTAVATRSTHDTDGPFGRGKEGGTGGGGRTMPVRFRSIIAVSMAGALSRASPTLTCRRRQNAVSRRSSACQ